MHQPIKRYNSCKKLKANLLISSFSIHKSNSILKVASFMLFVSFYIYKFIAFLPKRKHHIGILDIQIWTRKRKINYTFRTKEANIEPNRFHSSIKRKEKRKKKTLEITIRGSWDLVRKTAPRNPSRERTSYSETPKLLSRLSNVEHPSRLLEMIPI